MSFSSVLNGKQEKRLKCWLEIHTDASWVTKKCRSGLR